MLNKAYIDLNILKNNAIKIKKLLPKGVEFNAVVKADAYGHGALEIVNAIYTIADSFSVAIVEEGLALRRCGVKKDVLVLIPPFLQDVENAVFADLIMTVDSINRIKTIERICKKLKKCARVHIKVNTGMNRLGISVNELKDALYYISKSRWVKAEGIYSHLSMPEKEKLTKLAVDKFLLAKNIAKSYNSKIKAHISASGGFLKGYYFDMVRIGILIYGYKPFESDKISVKPVMKILAPVITSRFVNKGECLLYGEYKTQKEQYVNLVRVGYADGFERKKHCDICNNRCMDITAYKAEKGKSRYVEILKNAQEEAEKTETISYEILTKSAHRAEKIYIR